MELEATMKRARAACSSSPMDGEPDRLSALPDCLLHTIMSFMKARQVVQTCVLSTRWKHLWRSVRCLNLDLGEFKDDEDSDSQNSTYDYEDWEHFEDFAVNLMIRHNIALLESFRLQARRVHGRGPYFTRERSSAWASVHLRGYRGTVTENELGHNQFKLLCSISNATCLELSNLETMVHSKDSTTFKEFRNLRNLTLDKCDLSDDFETLVLFLLNSPNLEKLTLRCCKFSNDSKKKKGTPKPKKTSSSQCHSLDVQCVNLKLTEIIYKDDDVRQLVELLLRISGNLPRNHLKLRKMD
ncbi:hypothetical protein QOZ80_9BG0716770 [Eleusine coracana subsp. coracana]|nr:hypothetical protein QOZ80_9BG0716770 [Eleusine coracana subsp. coracana]